MSVSLRTVAERWKSQKCFPLAVRERSVTDLDDILCDCPCSVGNGESNDHATEIPTSHVAQTDLALSTVEDLLLHESTHKYVYAAYVVVCAVLLFWKRFSNACAVGATFGPFSQ